MHVHRLNGKNKHGLRALATSLLGAIGVDRGAFDGDRESGRVYTYEKVPVRLLEPRGEMGILVRFPFGGMGIVRITSLLRG